MICEILSQRHQKRLRTLKLSTCVTHVDVQCSHGRCSANRWLRVAIGPVRPQSTASLADLSGSAIHGLSPCEQRILGQIWDKNCFNKVHFGSFRFNVCPYGDQEARRGDGSFTQYAAPPPIQNYVAFLNVVVFRFRTFLVMDRRSS